MYFSHSSAIVALIDVRTSACLHSLRHFFVALLAARDVPVGLRQRTDPGDNES